MGSHLHLRIFLNNHPILAIVDIRAVKTIVS